ncbi:MAG TPA: bifunctional diguanylate cyclase/phosphodiesterase [Acidimicrobiia bacterium]|jgi:diguanylate cyclase (GGDEF)-like protein
MSETVTNTTDRARHPGTREAVVAAVTDDPVARLLLEVGAEGPVVIAASDGVEAVLGEDPDAVAGRGVRELVASGGARALVDAAGAVLARPARRRRCRVEATASNPGRTRVQWALSALPRVADDLVLVELSVPDDERSGHTPLFDSATGVATRTLFVDRIAHALTRTRRNESLVAVLALDVGAASALDDQVLEAFARIVEHNLRGSDTLARVGETTFMALLEDIGTPGAATIPAERILDACRRPIRVDTELVHVAIDVGLVVSPGGAATWPDGIIRDAERALDEARAAADGRPHTPGAPAPALTGTRHELAAQLADPLAARRIEPYFQHIVVLADREPVGIEAFMRWHHPHAGVLEAREFLPAAIESDVASVLGARVRTEALRATATWLREDPQRYLSINLSDGELHAPGLRGTLIDAVETADVDRSQLALEIGESTFMHGTGTRGRVLRELHDSGFPIVIDGYGEEHSSYRHFEDFPVDAVKVSGRLTAGIGRTPASERVLLGILAMLHFLEIPVIATAVETPNQLAFLEAHGCQFAQGYLFHPPIPAGRLTDAALDLRELETRWLPPIVVE